MIAVRTYLLISVLVAGSWAAPSPQDKKPDAQPQPQAQFTFDILPDAGDLVTRLGSDCDAGATAQAQSSSSSFSMVLPGGIAVSASFSEARSAAGAGAGAGAPLGTPSPFRGRGVQVTGPNGVTYNIRAPIEADFKVEGPLGTRWAVQRQATTTGAAITFPKQ